LPCTSCHPHSAQKKASARAFVLLFLVLDLLDPLETSDALFSVSDLAFHIKRVLECDPILSDLAVTGEVSNFKVHSKGHVYFSLKDESAQIECKMWRSAAAGLGFRPQNGDRVTCFGSVDFYPPQGRASLVVREMHFAGQGAQFEAFLRLKTQLESEGLFEEGRKKPLPLMPRTVGVITSPTGAVIRDILNVLARRYPLAQVVLIPSAVQGFSAPPDLIRALHFAEAWAELDVVIMARGGGSAEDLWCFNDEELARTAADFSIPLVSAIGHETDFTILDFVADKRAPTPSAAAELIAPDVRELLGYVLGLKMRMGGAIEGEVRLARQKLEFLKRSRAFTNPSERLGIEREKVVALRNRAQEASKARVKIETQRLEGIGAQLRALDPQRVLERGYALLSDAQTGQIVSLLEGVSPGQKLVVTLSGGQFQVAVETIRSPR